MKNLTSLKGLILVAGLLALSLPLYTFFWIYPHFTALITFEKEVNAKQIATHISKMLMLEEGATTLTRENITDTFIVVLKEAQSDFDLTRVKIFSAGGEILYSTDASDIGNVNTNSYFTDIVARGQMFSKTVHKNEKTMEERVVRKNVVETYVPIMRNNHFLGAFEIYYDITYSGYSLGSFVAKSRVIILSISLVLLMTILSLGVAAIRAIREIRRAEKRMQRLKDRIPPLYSIPEDEMDD